MKRSILVPLFASFILLVAILAGPAALPRVAHAAGVLTAQETSDMQYQREEEKLARDVYTVMNEKWQLRIFSNIAQSEQRHTDAVRSLISKYRITDPAIATAPGVFVNGELQALYDDLVFKGSQSKDAAIGVGVLIEQTDIADLKKAMANTSKADILQVYANLLDGSYNHLAAFGGH
jgi:hypothetical protein